MPVKSAWHVHVCDCVPVSVHYTRENAIEETMRWKGGGRGECECEGVEITRSSCSRTHCAVPAAVVVLAIVRVVVAILSLPAGLALEAEDLRVVELLDLERVRVVLCIEGDAVDALARETRFTRVAEEIIRVLALKAFIAR